MLKFGATLIAPVAVERIVPAAAPADFHALHLDCGAVVEARTILLAAGVRWRKLDADGAERFESAGVHYACTSVEAILYDAQDVAVVGAGNSAGQAAMFLSECCRDRKVHLLVRKRLGPGMSDYLVGRIRSSPNVVVHEGVEIASVHGGRRLEGVVLRHAKDADARRAAGRRGPRRPENTETLPPGRSQSPPRSSSSAPSRAAAGCPTGSRATPWATSSPASTPPKSGRWPLADREPCPLETTLPRVLAAGDIRAGSTKRVGFAVGDGSLAVTCVHKLTAIR